MADDREPLRPLSPSQRKFLEEAVSRYQESATPEVAAYLADRGITPELADEYRLGVVVDPMPGHGRFKGFLAIPYLDHKGSPLSIRFRCLEDHEHRDYYHGKYMSMEGEQPRMFNVGAIHRAGDTIHVAEGECLRGDAEVLTRAGWKRLDELEPGEEVAQYEFLGTLRFVKPIAYIAKEFDGELIEYKNGQRYYSLTTPGHRMPAFGGKRSPFQFTTAEKGGPLGRHIPRVGILDGPGIELPDDAIRLLLAISADGTIDVRSDGSQYIRFALKRERKVERLRKLLANLGIEASDNRVAQGHQSICFRMPEGLTAFKELPGSWLVDASREQREMILRELREWDGNGVPNRAQEEYSTRLRANAEWVQTLCHTTGRVSTVMARSNQLGEWFKVSILHRKNSTSWQSLRTYERVPHKGKVYCVQVPSSAFLVRMGGCISVTGNCDAILLNSIGLPAVGVPGVEAWLSRHRRMLAGFSKVWVWADPDDAGAKLAARITRSLRSAQIVPLRPETGDVTDLWKAGGPAALLELIEEGKRR